MLGHKTRLSKRKCLKSLSFPIETELLTANEYHIVSVHCRCCIKVCSDNVASIRHLSDDVIPQCDLGRVTKADVPRFC